MEENEDIFEKLMVTKNQSREELKKQIDLAANFLNIESHSGKIIFKNYPNLTDYQRILIVLIGKYFAKEKGFEVNDSLSVSEISKEISRPMTTLSGNLKKLKRDKYIEQFPNKKYKVISYRITEIFKKVFELKLNKEGDKNGSE